MTLNPDFVLNCVLRSMFGALKRGFRSTAILILVRNVVGELQPKRILAASRGFLAAARLSCIDDDWYGSQSMVHCQTFLADRTNGRTYGTVLRPSVVSDVMYCGQTVRPSKSYYRQPIGSRM